MLAWRICLIETGARSVVVLMRPRTAALPAPLPFPSRAGARAFLPAPSRCMFGGPICGIETGRRVGRHVDAAEDGRAPDRRCLLHRVQERGHSCPPPAGVCSVARSAELKQVVGSVVTLMRPRTAALPTVGVFSTACRSAGILARPQPVYVRWPGFAGSKRVV